MPLVGIWRALQRFATQAVTSLGYSWDSSLGRLNDGLRLQGGAWSSLLHQKWVSHSFPQNGSSAFLLVGLVE